MCMTLYSDIRDRIPRIVKRLFICNIYPILHEIREYVYVSVMYCTYIILR